MAGSVIGLSKTGLIKLAGPWRTAEQLEIATLEYVCRFNHRRLYDACGDIPPATTGGSVLAQQARLSEAVFSTTLVSGLTG